MLNPFKKLKTKYMYYSCEISIRYYLGKGGPAPTEQDTLFLHK